MRHTSKTLTAFVAVCTVLSCHAGIVTSTEVNEGEANSGGRLQRVIRSSKSRSGGLAKGGGTHATTDLEAGETACDLTRAGLLEARDRKLNLLSTVNVRSPNPLVAVVRNLLMESGAKDLEIQPYLLLTKIADAMLEGLTVCDERGTVVYVNDSLCRMLATTRGALIGRSATEVFPGIYARFVQAKQRPCACVRAFRR